MTVSTTRGRLLAWVGLVLIVAFMASNAISYHVTKSSLKKSVVETELPLTGNTIFSEIQADLVRPIFVSSQMATDTFLRDWVLSGEKDPSSVQRYLDSVRSHYGFSTAFFVSNETMRYYHYQGVSKTISRDSQQDSWFFRTRDLDADYEVNVDSNEQQFNAITVFINYKVFDYSGRFIGITGVGMDLDAMATIIERYRGDFSRNVYFVEPSGQITLHPDGTFAYRKMLSDIPGIGALADKITASKGGSFEYETKDDTILLNTRYIPELHWILMVEQLESDATAAASNGILFNIAIALSAIILTGVAIFLVINRYQRRLEEMATTDPLTGINNRQVFDVSMRQAMERANRNGQPLSVVIIDLDHFKSINDRLGHLVGDDVLKAVAKLFSENIRSTDILARWGGEEFSLLLENCSEAAATKMVDGIRQKLADAKLLAKYPELTVTASFGVACLAIQKPQPKGDGEKLLLRADAALYRAKREGRNKVMGSDDPQTTAEANGLNEKTPE